MVIQIRLRVVAAFLLFTELHLSAIKPHLHGVIEFVLSCMQQDKSEELALETTEFWKILTYRCFNEELDLSYRYLSGFIEQHMIC